MLFRLQPSTGRYLDCPLFQSSTQQADDLGRTRLHSALHLSGHIPQVVNNCALNRKGLSSTDQTLVENLFSITSTKHLDVTLHFVMTMRRFVSGNNEFIFLFEFDKRQQISINEIIRPCPCTCAVEGFLKRSLFNVSCLLLIFHFHTLEDRFLASSLTTNTTFTEYRWIHERQFCFTFVAFI